MAMREVFHMPTEVNTRTNISHTMLNDPYFSGTNVQMALIQFQYCSPTNMNKIYSHSNSSCSFLTDGMMMTSQHTETSGMVTRHVTKEVVQRSVMGGATVTKQMFYES